MPELAIYMDNLAGNMDADRAARLSQAGTVSRWYVNAHQNRPSAIASFALRVMPAATYVWVNFYDKPIDALNLLDEVMVHSQDGSLNRSLLDIEKGMEYADLDPYIARSKRHGPVVVSGGYFLLPELGVLDYKAMDGCEIEWQAYLDSGEGAPPDQCVRSLFQPGTLQADGSPPDYSTGRKYRASFTTTGGGVVYRWLRGVGMNQDRVGFFSLADTLPNGTTRHVLVRAWYDGANVHVDQSDKRLLYTVSSQTRSIGTLLGFAPYAKIRCALDVSSPAALAVKRTPEQWGELAATARFPGYGKRGVSLFTQEVSDPVIRAIKASIG